MRLYYSRGACSLAAHIAAREGGLPVDLVQVDLGAHKYAEGLDYFRVNPRGYVPLLELNDGERITETGVIVQYLAEQGKNPALLPPAGTIERIRVQEWLNFVSTELHKVFSPWLWHKETAASTQEKARSTLSKRFAELDKVLGRSNYLTGEVFTVADAYAFAILNWTNLLHMDISAYPNLKAYLVRVGSRPEVSAALKYEHLRVPGA